MWRPAANRGVSGTNEVPLGGKRRFGLPEEAPPPPVAAPPNYSRPPPADMQFFNGRQERDRVDDRRDDYRRDDYDRRRDDRGGGRYDERDGRDREVKRERKWDDDYSRDDRGRDSERGREPPPPPPEGQSSLGLLPSLCANCHEDGPRKRRSRWGDANERVDVAGLPVTVTGKVSQTELDSYAIHVRLEEINRKLRTGDVVPAENQRSPSPPPTYDAYGRRTNNRDVRYRKKLEDERTRLVDRAMKSDPNFRAPGMEMAGSRRFGKPQDKVYIPVKEFPEINFFGLLVGPRGNSLKKMERESGAKISIRGKGSVKEGKGRPEAWAGDEDDELHCLVMGDNDQQVKTCVALINRVIETAASTPEGQNDHKRNQLRELASLNGTLRDDENQLCQNCGEKGHRRWECPQQRVYSANVICRLCGGAGHMARDCRGRGDPNLQQNKATQFDSEYTALMAELGEGGTGGPGGAPVAAIGGTPQQAQAPQDRVPPWRLPENWNTQSKFSRNLFRCLLTLPSDFRAQGGAPGGHPGFQQPQQGYNANAGYGYGGGYGDAAYGQGGAGGAGGADPYAAFVTPLIPLPGLTFRSYYASMGQAAPVA
ncbi:hypothetical protein BCR39DRAFT_472450 [Naematelia encephala]|uniref:Branchpoint-bridging protein n=1 Tax=Naematelia encephala TaxID=71784 RepID=A0A1Y2AP60_9TREE|nr:hypothetical protein BCR39DRAFT_472450 [Naematelia encephala]